MKKDENRLYIQWNVKSRDGKELKVYIEIGCTAGLKPAEIREKSHSSKCIHILLLTCHILVPKSLIIIRFGTVDQRVVKHKKIKMTV